MCNVSEHVQVYIIPPLLKSSISFLSNLVVDAVDSRVLYCVVIAREAGLESFANASEPFIMDVTSTSVVPQMANIPIPVKTSGINIL